MYFFVMLSWNHVSSYPGVLQLYHMIMLLVFIYIPISWGHSILTYIIEALIYIHTNIVLGFLTTSHAFSPEFVVFLRPAICSGMKWALSVVLFCISIWLRWMNIVHILISLFSFSLRSASLICSPMYWLYCHFANILSSFYIMDINTFSDELPSTISHTVFSIHSASYFHWCVWSNFIKSNANN